MRPGARGERYPYADCSRSPFTWVNPGRRFFLLGSAISRPEGAGPHWSPLARSDALRDEDAAEDEDEGGGVVEVERLAEDQDGEERAEHRHEVHEQARPPRPDELDAAHEEQLRQERRKQADEQRDEP